MGLKVYFLGLLFETLSKFLVKLVTKIKINIFLNLLIFVYLLLLKFYILSKSLSMTLRLSTAI